jgi:hypothetical protein
MRECRALPLFDFDFDLPSVPSPELDLDLPVMVAMMITAVPFVIIVVPSVIIVVTTVMVAGMPAMVVMVIFVMARAASFRQERIGCRLIGGGGRSGASDEDQGEYQAELQCRDFHANLLEQ